MPELRSDELVNRIYQLVHDERNERGEATELHVAALELAQYHLEVKDRLERAVQNLTKGYI